MSGQPGNGQVVFSATTNSFPILNIPDERYYQYTIDIATSSSSSKKTALSRQKNIQLLHHLQHTVCPRIFNPRIIYDGEALGYCAARLDFSGRPSASFTISLNSSEIVTRGVTITIARTAGEPINPREALSTVARKGITPEAQVALNLIQNIIRQWPNMQHANNGRAYYPLPRSGKGEPIGAGLELLRGIFQSVRPCSNPRTPLVLQIDTCTAAVYQSGPLINLCMDFLKCRDVANLSLAEHSSGFRALEKHLKKLKVKYSPNGRFDNPRQLKTKVIFGLVAAAGRYEFVRDDHRVTVAEFFHRLHGLPVKHVDIIGVRFTPRESERPVIVPLQCCFVEPGQLFKKKIPDNLVHKVVDFATLKPRDKKYAILDAVKNYTRSEFVHESRINIDSQPMVAPARQISPPGILYTQPGQPGQKPKLTTAAVRDGAWNVAGSGMLLQDPQAMEHWGYINLRPDQISMEEFQAKMMELCNRCGGLGMKVQPPLFQLQGNPQYPTGQLDAATQAIMQKYGTQSVPFVVVVGLPDNSAEIRHLVKHWGDIRNGYITQCLRISKVRSAREQYWSNVVLKLNARLGGRNNIVDSHALRQALMGPSNMEITVVMGADASHPAPGVQKPTVTSLVFSKDQFATAYSAITSIQEPRTEIIANMKTLVYTALKIFTEQIKKPLTRILFFRDGVSEGEYDEVRKRELTAIEDAIQMVWAKYKFTAPKPKILFIIVGKRHHSAFFNGDMNCSAGTVIDQGVTLPNELNFYLQSHSAIRGTARSGHYVVLRNDIFDNIQQIEEVAYSLCYVYAKATRSVSIPAPVYYADLACARGDFHLDPRSRLLSDSGSVSSGSNNGFDMDAWRQAFQSAHNDQRYRMYFL
ncbi:Piwi domain-containing protein [Panaeolus papilionaceus]|nr:Piwi domain-containing protein [Panaeolus papilionaceus]